MCAVEGAVEKVVETEKDTAAAIREVGEENRRQRELDRYAADERARQALELAERKERDAEAAAQAEWNEQRENERMAEEEQRLRLEALVRRAASADAEAWSEILVFCDARSPEQRKPFLYTTLKVAYDEGDDTFVQRLVSAICRDRADWITLGGFADDRLARLEKAQQTRAREASDADRRENAIRLEGVSARWRQEDREKELSGIRYARGELWRAFVRWPHPQKALQLQAVQ